MKNLKCCLYCGDDWEVLYFPFCSIGCQKKYESFYNSILWHRKKNNLEKWINQDENRFNRYNRFLKYKTFGIKKKLPNKKPLYFLASF